MKDIIDVTIWENGISASEFIDLLMKENEKWMQVKLDKHKFKLIVRKRCRTMYGVDIFADVSLSDDEHFVNALVSFGIVKKV